MIGILRQADARQDSPQRHGDRAQPHHLEDGIRSHSEDIVQMLAHHPKARFSFAHAHGRGEVAAHVEHQRRLGARWNREADRPARAHLHEMAGWPNRPVRPHVDARDTQGGAPLGQRQARVGSRRANVPVVHRNDRGRAHFFRLGEGHFQRAIRREMHQAAIAIDDRGSRRSWVTRTRGLGLSSPSRNCRV